MYFENIALGINIISQCATERPRRKLTAYGRHSTKLRFVRPPAAPPPAPPTLPPPCKTSHRSYVRVCTIFIYHKDKRNAANVLPDVPFVVVVVAAVCVWCLVLFPSQLLWIQ